jgi:hypothetical protein
MDKYEDVIVSLGLLDLEDDNNRLLIHFISYYLHFSKKINSSILMSMFVKVDIFNLLFLVVIGLGVI